jgi:hypothetical protein
MLFFLFGPVKKTFAAVKTWNPAGCGSTSWNTAGNWTGGLPGTADIATFDGATSNCNVTVDTTIDVAGINITGSYTGTITQGNGNDVTVRGSGYTQNASGSTFTGGGATSDFTMHTSFGGAFSLTSGTFNAPAGTTTFTGSYTKSGTYTASSGTTIFYVTTNTITGSTTFNNLTFQTTFGQNNMDIASGTTITANGTLTIDGSSDANDTLYGPGGITANGDVAVVGEGLGSGGAFSPGDVIITITGSGTQTLTGESDSDSQLPGITISKTGTLNIVSTVVIGGNWTLSSGSINAGSSNVIFSMGADWTITGTQTLNNVTFITSSGQRSCTIASGTTITVLGDLTIDGSSDSNDGLYGPGGLSVRGNLIAIGGGFRDGTSEPGDVIITMNGDGPQAIIGEADEDTGIPGITIDKQSGTLTLTDSVVVGGNWTYIKGIVDPGTSTIIFTSKISNISGSMNFNNLFFYTESGLGSTTIGSGTILNIVGDLIIDGTTDNNDSIVGPGALNIQGDVSVINSTYFQDVPITFSGSKDQSLTSDDGSLTDGTVTINKTAGTVILGSNLSLGGTGQDLVIANGILNYNSYSLGVIDTTTINGQMNGSTGTFVNVGPVVVGTKGVWSQSPSGTIFLANTVTNSGFIRFQGGGSTCGGSNNITLSASGGSSSWSGGGTFILNDLTIQDMQGGLTAYSSTNNGNTNWTFNAGCPAYSNRSTVNVTGGTKISAGTKLKSN